MLPQPPPNAPAPPPSEEALRSRRWWRGIWVVGVLSMVVVLAAILIILPTFGFRRGHRRSDEREAINNARQIGIALIEFEAEFGKYPDASTITAVETATGKVVPPGTKTSNDLFRQLYVMGYAPSESVFYAKNRDSHKPDGYMEGRHFSEKGECGFTYFLGATDKDNKRRLIVAAPMIPGTDRFDPKPFDGKAVFLKIDYSTFSLPIDKDGHAILDGRNLMDPHHPIWDGHAPSIAWPDF